MRRKGPGAILLAVAALSLAAAALAQSADSATTKPAEAPTTLPALSPHDLELLHELETGDWHTRKKAEAELADRDASDAPVLRAMIDQASNPEARARLNDALVTISTNTALGASRITLHVKDAPAEQVYAEIFRQAHAPLVPMGKDLFTQPAAPLVSLDVDRQSFWAVMEALYPRTGMMVVQAGPSDFRLARTAPIGPGPRVEHGPILIVADQVQAAVSQAIPSQPNPANPAALFRRRPPRVGFGLVMTAYVEPRIKVLKMTYLVLVDQATDDNGNSLLSDRRFPPPEGEESGGGFPRLLAQLKFPESNPGKHITIFRGTVTFDVLIETQKLEIPDLMTAAGRDFSINDRPVKFLGCKKVGNDYWVGFSSVSGTNDPWDMDVEDSQAKMRVLDSGGHDLANAGIPPGNVDIFGGIAAQAGTIDHTIVFRPRKLANGAATGEPSKLVWDLPGKTHQIVVPIEFKDLDMNFQGR